MTMQWLLRSWARRRLGREVGVWYHAEYKADCLRRTGRVGGLVLDRGERVISALRTEGLLSGDHVNAAPLASLAELCAFHPSSYLSATTEREHLAMVYAVPAEQIDVDCVLRAARRAVGGTIAAARWAVAAPGRRAVNLGGGFHHAEPEAGSGFCVYNDIAVAIALLRADGFDAPVAIVDLDAHQGDGNIVAFANDASVLTYSLHGSVWTHVEAVADHQVLLAEGTDDRAYLDTLSSTLPALLAAHRPKLIFYVAGNDVLAGDELGSFRLSFEGLFERDRRVLQASREVGASVVVTLGGGYTPLAWWGSVNLLRYLIVPRSPATPPPAPEDPRLRFNRVAAILDPFELQGERVDDWTLDEREVLDGLQHAPTLGRRFLGYYSTQGLELALQKYGVLDRLREKGFSDLRVQVKLEEGDRQRLTIHGTKGGHFHLLVDAVVSRARRRLTLGEDSQPVELLHLEWLQLQDPSRDFTLRHPPLPGQSHPGLGMGRETMELLYQVCRRLGLDGILFHPSRYHIAVLAKSAFRFLDPARQGRFEALCDTLDGMPLAEASSKLERGRVHDAAGEVIPWEAEDYVVALTPRLADYLASEAYREACAEAKRAAEARGIAVAAV